MPIKNKYKNRLIFISLFLFITTSIVNGDELIIEIDNPKFSEKGLNDRVYEIKAKKGFKTDNELELFTIEGKFKMEEDGKWIYLVADKGNFSQINNFIKLEENIVFYTDEGEKIKSSYATFDMNSDIIKLSESVSYENIKGLVLSDNSVISENFNKIIYSGNVKSIIKLSD